MPSKPPRSTYRSLRDLSPGQAAKTVGRVASRASAAAISTAKTSVLRRDRASDEHHAERLKVCQNCPGGHAVLGKDGEVRTCGSMLASLTIEGKSTCGCVLNTKARDVKQACPFGYWEEVDRRAAWSSVKPRAVVAGLSDLLMSRRAMLGGTLAAGGSLLLTRKVQASESGKCYVKIKPCGGEGDATHVYCSDVLNKPNGFKFRNKAKGDGNCYEIDGVELYAQYGVLATIISGDSDGCENCGEESPAPCNCPSGLGTEYQVTGGEPFTVESSGGCLWTVTESGYGDGEFFDGDLFLDTDNCYWVLEYAYNDPGPGSTVGLYRKITGQTPKGTYILVSDEGTNPAPTTMSVG